MTVFYIKSTKTSNCVCMDRNDKDDASILYAFRTKTDAIAFYKEVFKENPDYKVVKGNLK